MALISDYLVIGAGASGLAFADELFTRDESAHITLVDRRDAPGGHWNDAYTFVRLHQPATFYGVESRELARGEIERTGPNAGNLVLSEGPEIVQYFHSVLRDRLLPSGRVRFVPMSEVESDGCTVRHLLSGTRQRVEARRKVVDAAYLTNAIPSTHERQFTVAPGLACIPPNDLPRRAAAFQRYAVLGGGKTAFDVALWLLANGAPPEAITWVMPRDGWLVNRGKVQAAMPFFDTVFTSIAEQREAMAVAASADDLALKLEACGAWLRLDRAVRPSMFHFATVSETELAVLRGIRNVVRRGRVQAIELQRMVLAQGEVALPGDETLFIDCTASALSQRPTTPVFDGARITLQMIRIPQPTFSAACIAFIETTMREASDADKNRFTTPVKLPDSVEEFPQAQITDQMNRHHAARHPALRAWMTASRLDGYAKLIAAADPNDAARMALLARVQAASRAAMENLPRLVS